MITEKKKKVERSISSTIFHNNYHEKKKKWYKNRKYHPIQRNMPFLNSDSPVQQLQTKQNLSAAPVLTIPERIKHSTNNPVSFGPILFSEMLSPPLLELKGLVDQQKKKIAEVYKLWIWMYHKEGKLLKLVHWVRKEYFCWLSVSEMVHTPWKPDNKSQTTELSEWNLPQQKKKLETTKKKNQTK